MVEMPTLIVLVNGKEFPIVMDVDQAAKDLLMGDRHVWIEPVGGYRTCLIRDQIAYVQAYSDEPHGRELREVTQS